MDIPGPDPLITHMDREAQETLTNLSHLDEGYRTAGSTQIKGPSPSRKHDCSKEL